MAWSQYFKFQLLNLQFETILHDFQAVTQKGGGGIRRCGAPAWASGALDQLPAYEQCVTPRDEIAIQAPVLRCAFYLVRLLQNVYVAYCIYLLSWLATRSALWVTR